MVFIRLFGLLNNHIAAWPIRIAPNCSGLKGFTDSLAAPTGNGAAYMRGSDPFGVLMWSHDKRKACP